MWNYQEIINLGEIASKELGFKSLEDYMQNQVKGDENGT